MERKFSPLSNYVLVFFHHMPMSNIVRGKQELCREYLHTFFESAVYCLECIYLTHNSVKKSDRRLNFSLKDAPSKALQDVLNKILVRLFSLLVLH